MSDSAGGVLVRCHGVTRTYGGDHGVAALRDVHAAVAAGDRIAVTGPSGSGKSTLLHLLGGLDAPSSGSVSWPGPADRPTDRPGLVGFVFQAPSLLAPLDVVENVSLPLLVAGGTDAEARQRALAALTVLGVAELADRLPAELSGGQAQRVAVARVLAARPPLILADEPTARLDSVQRDLVIDALLALSRRSGAALVVSTHDSAVADCFPVRWHMRDGRLEQATATGAAADPAAGAANQEASAC